MKKVILTLIATMLIFSVFAKTLTLTQLAKAPTIDAKETDWTSTWNAMDQIKGTTSSMIAKMQVGYDQAALYAVVDVTDYSADTSSTNSYENDCVEVFISLDTNSYKRKGKYVSGTLQLRKQRDKDFPRGIDGGQGHGSSKDTANIGGEIWSVQGFKDHGKVVEDDQGTKFIQEWMIPWKQMIDSVNLFGKPWTWDGKAIKFEITASDNTGLPAGATTGGRTQQSFWNSNADVQWDDTRADGTLILSTPVSGTSSSLSFQTISGLAYGSRNIRLSASHFAGLPITYSSSNVGVAKIKGDSLIIVGAGSVTITASNATSGTYVASNVTQTIFIDKAQQVITKNLDNYIYPALGDAALTLTATISSNLPLTIASSDINIVQIVSGKLVFKNTGQAIITISQSGNSNYYSSQATINVSIAKGTPVITFESIPILTLADSTYKLVGTCSSGLSLSYLSSNSKIITISGDKALVKGIGICTITASVDESANYIYGSALQYVLVTKANQTITFGILPIKLVTDTAAFSITAVSTSKLPVVFSSSNPSVAIIKGSKVSVKGGGMAIISASQPGNASYNAAPVVLQSLNVNKLKQTLKFATIPAQSIDAKEFLLDATSSSGLPVYFVSSDSTIASVQNSKVKIKKAGILLISAVQDGNSIYDTASVAQKVEIKKGVNVRNVTENAISIYPNPASSELNLKSSQLIDKLEMFDLLGKLIDFKNVNAFAAKLQVDNYDNGIYMLKIYTSEGISVNKIIIKK